MAMDNRRVQAIVAEAAALASPAERASYLNGAGGDDADLRERVRALLASYETAGKAVVPPPSGGAR